MTRDLEMNLGLQWFLKFFEFSRPCCSLLKFTTLQKVDSLFRRRNMYLYETYELDNPKDFSPGVYVPE